MTNAEKKVRYEQFRTQDHPFADPIDLPSLTELQLLLKDSITFKSAKIIVNDHFCNRLLVAPEETVSIDYDQLRSEPVVVPNRNRNLKLLTKKSTMIQIQKPPLKKPRVNSQENSQSFPKFIPPSLDTRLPAIVELQGKLQQDISLIVTPCRNGILEKSAIAVDDSGKKCSVEKI